MTGVRISVLRTAGSAPRDAGTQMMVWPDRIVGTIGGGALEWDAMAFARRMLTAGEATAEYTVPLGPSLGQCCGGSVTLRFEQAEALDPPQAEPLWIYGAGHVGRALVTVLGPLPAFDITWVDTSADRFPADTSMATPLVATNPARAVGHAPDQAHHLILTYSHDLDLGLCDALLRHGFASCGLIGSGTKWARFQRRLQALGHTPAQIARIACPIGDTALGKHPQALAIGVAHAMLTPERKARLGDKAG